jgi:hypothetical protein
MSSLKVHVDGVPLSEEEGRAFWRRFSVWMDQNPGDLAGFARTVGLASVHPEMHADGPVLVGSRTTPQKPYAEASAAGKSRMSRRR